MMKLNKYGVEARLLPAIISMLPIFAFTYFFLDPKISSFIDYVLKIKIMGYFTLSVVLVVLFMHICRLVSKVYQRKFFKEELFMPTTNYMLYSDNYYTDDFKEKIERKINNDFNIKLLSKTEEQKNEVEARKRIVEAMSQIRLKVKNGSLLLQHNIEYGFWRNLIGGSTVAVIISLINIIILQNDNIALTISIVMLCFYLIPVLLSKYIIIKLGENYAKILLQEYRSL